MRQWIKIIIASLIGFITVGELSAQVNLKVSMDSAKVLMGNLTPYHINLLAPNDGSWRMYIPHDSLNKYVEIAQILPADTIEPSPGRLEIKQTLMLQSFDSGLYRLKPILVISGQDTLKSDELALKVEPVNVDTLQNIHDYAGVVDVDRQFLDYIPDFIIDYWWWILGIIVLVLGGGFFFWFYLRKRRKPSQKKIKVVPPYEQAISQLQLLKIQHLCEHGREREFYTKLTEILRIYLERRFSINAMEMTTRQILRQLEEQPEAKLSKEYMNQVLKMADFVKFAKMRPLPEDNVGAFDSAVKFVEETKPQPVQNPNKDDNAAL